MHDRFLLVAKDVPTGVVTSVCVNAVALGKLTDCRGDLMSFD